MHWTCQFQKNLWGATSNAQGVTDMHEQSQLPPPADIQAAENSPQQVQCPMKIRGPQRRTTANQMRTPSCRFRAHSSKDHHYRSKK
eukprot:4076224-Amphidinium_carterae.6